MDCAEDLKEAFCICSKLQCLNKNFGETCWCDRVLAIVFNNQSNIIPKRKYLYR